MNVAHPSGRRPPQHQLLALPGPESAGDVGVQAPTLLAHEVVVAALVATEPVYARPTLLVHTEPLVAEVAVAQVGSPPPLLPAEPQGLSTVLPVHWPPRSSRSAGHTEPTLTKPNSYSAEVRKRRDNKRPNSPFITVQKVSIFFRG